MPKNNSKQTAESDTTYSHTFWENYTLFLVKQGIGKKYVNEDLRGMLYNP